jgi:hypothetical protein
VERGPVATISFLLICFIVQVSEYFPDHHRVFNSGDDLDGATAFSANTSLLEGRLLAGSSYS